MYGSTWSIGFDRMGRHGTAGVVRQGLKFAPRNTILDNTLLTLIRKIKSPCSAIEGAPNLRNRRNLDP